MKKLIIATLLTIPIFASCTTTKPNRIEIITTYNDSENTIIQIDKSYEFLDFQKEYKNGKCTVTINYTKNK